MDLGVLPGDILVSGMDTAGFVKNTAGGVLEGGQSILVSDLPFDLYTLLLGWFPLWACTYEGADAPTYTISFASDMTSTLAPGMRIKLTDSTVKYFIITAVGAYSGGKTIITIYGGTDYTLSGGALSSPYYSLAKAPFGFPLSSDKWTVEITDNQSRTQASPTQNTWYNLGSVDISIPIGIWNVEYDVNVGANVSGGGNCEYQTTLSTANNSESDNAMTTHSANLTTTWLRTQHYKRKNISNATKTAYYLNTRSVQSGTSEIVNGGDLTKTIIRAICAYL